MRKAAVVLIAFASALGPAALIGTGQKTPPPGPSTAKRPQERAGVHEFMQRKRQLSHDVFDALVLKKFKRIAKSANSLGYLTRAEEWQVRKTPRYLQYSTEFQEAAEKLANKARDRDLDGATLAFADMTRCCVRCHEYIRTSRD